MGFCTDEAELTVRRVLQRTDELEETAPSKMCLEMTVQHFKVSVIENGLLVKGSITLSVLGNRGRAALVQVRDPSGKALPQHQQPRRILSAGQRA